MPISDHVKKELLQRFVPVLYLDRSEPFYPVSPIDYVQQSALWTSVPPDHPKDTWGIAAGPQRVPLVKRGDVSLGAEHELLNVPEGHHGEIWFDRAGWQDSGDVATQTENRRAVNAGAALAQPWYCADVWSVEEWRQTLDDADVINRFGLGPGDRPDDLQRIVLTFYFFFPFHREGRRDTALPPERDPYCGDYAGDWTAFAVIGRVRDGSELVVAADFEPLFGAFGQRWRGTHSDHVDQASSRMFLRPWSNLLKVEDHPVVVAASGTHNLYPHDEPVAPNGTIKPTWLDFGQRTSEPANELVKDATEEPYAAVLAIKILAGLAVGGPIGLIVGAAASAAEASWAEEEGLMEAPKLNPEPPPERDDPLAEDAIDLEKQNIAVPAGTTSVPFADMSQSELREWSVDSAQALVGNSYLLSLARVLLGDGFKGRWGNRCTHDHFLVRSGIRLPDYRAQVIDALLKLT